MAVLLGLLIVGGATFVLLHRPTTGGPAAAASSGLQGGASSGGRAGDQAIPTPLTREEEVRQDIGRRREPFYRFLRENFDKAVLHFGVTDELDTLDLVVRSADTATTQSLIEQAVAPNAKRYGFRKVRFYVPNPPRSVEPTTLVAESTLDDSGHWNTFVK